MNLKSFIRDIPDFPKTGIIFKDITPLIADAAAFQEALSQIQKNIEGFKPTHLVGIESRGFIFAAALAAKMKIGFIPVRKSGKLPHKKSSVKHGLEYGEGELEIHLDACSSKDRVVIIDDVIATGGTALATIELLKNLNVKALAVAVLIELSFLKGREVIEKSGVPIFSSLIY